MNLNTIVKSVLVVCLTIGFSVTALNSQETPEAMARRVAQAKLERQPTADLGNGYYRNPVIVGPGSDNTVVRVGKDFYAMAGGAGWPDQLIWHSRDLVNWRPVTRAFHSGYAGGLYASEITYHKGRYYIYTTQVDDRRGPGGPLNHGQRSLVAVPFKDKNDRTWDNVVLWADKPEGPWSDPIKLGVYGLFDPGHVVDQQGNRFLYFNKGMMIRLAPDGLSTVGDLSWPYKGWDYPKEWVVECKCTEAPKFAYRSGYYYLVVAEGGTAGPSTAHMAAVARSKSPEGPWENSPYNPLIRTKSQEEKWWRQGHGTLIDDIAGDWWFFYTGYENGWAHYGKQSLLLPVEWTTDGWPRIRQDTTPTSLIRKPAGENVGNGMPLSDDFSSPTLGIQWTYSPTVKPDDLFRISDGKLIMKASGKIPGSTGYQPDPAALLGEVMRMAYAPTNSGGAQPEGAAMLSVNPFNHSYEVEVEVQIPDTAEGGLMLGAGRGGAAGAGGAFAVAGLRKGEAVAYFGRMNNYAKWAANRIFVRIRNEKQDISFHYSPDGKTWTQFENSTAVAGARRVSLYAVGQGEVVFRDFRYRGLD
ncbi:MAG: family 43 glycosylhydrolase [Bryobacteraceae bacterium]